MTGLDVYNNDNLQRILKYLDEHPKVRGFYGYLKTDKSLTSIYNYIKIAQNMLDYLQKDPSELSFDDYVGYMAINSTKEDGTPKTSSFAVLQYHALKNYSAYLFESGVATKNYMLGVKRPKAIESQKTIEKRSIGFLTKEELKIYMDAVRNGVGTDHAKVCQKRTRERDVAIIMIFLTTGIRKSAMVNLDISNVDFERKVLWVTDKGSKVHAYKLNDVTFEAIINWINKRKELFGDTKEDALFLTKYGLRLKDDGIKQIVMKYAVDINGKHITPHKLRVTYGTQLYEETKDIFFVQKAMGHGSLDTTARYIRDHSEVYNNGDAQKAIKPTCPVEELNIEELELSVRALNCLKRAGINTVGELCEYSYEELVKVRNLGRKSFEEVLAILNELGVSLKRKSDKQEDILVNSNDAANESKIIIDDSQLLDGTETIELSPSIYSSLKRVRISSIDDLIKQSPENFMNMRNLGRKSLEKVLSTLEELGLELDPDDDCFN